MALVFFVSLCIISISHTSHFFLTPSFYISYRLELFTGDLLQHIMDIFSRSHRVWCFSPWLYAVARPLSSRRRYFFRDHQALALYDYLRAVFKSYLSVTLGCFVFFLPHTHM